MMKQAIQCIFFLNIKVQCVGLSQTCEKLNVMLISVFSLVYNQPKEFLPEASACFYGSPEETNQTLLYVF